MSNSLDPDQVRRFVGPDLVPSCLQMLSTDDTRRQRVTWSSSLMNGKLNRKIDRKNVPLFTPLLGSFETESKKSISDNTGC